MNITALLAQFPVSLSIQTNLEVMLSVLEQTHPGDLVLFPEGAISGYSADLSFLARVDPSELAAGIESLRKEAVRCKVHVWAGSCIQKDGKWFNAAYGFTRDGRIQVYYKINLANHERGVFSTGSSLPYFELDLPAGKVAAGVQICRELRYPEQWGWLARRGAQVILHLNNATGDRSYQPIWKSHLVSRAAELQRFVLSANNADPEQVSPTIAIAPSGHVLGEVVSSEMGMLRLELDLSRVSNLYLEQSRTDVIAIRSFEDENAAQ